MLVYSVSSNPTFEMVQVIRDKILNHLVHPPSLPQTPKQKLTPPPPKQGTDSVPICIVGNKSDLRPEQRQVTAEEGKQLAERYKCAWTEASARYGENVSRAFELLIGEIEKSQNPNEPPANGKCELM